MENEPYSNINTPHAAKAIYKKDHSYDS